jgi:hypothetical protein
MFIGLDKRSNTNYVRSKKSNLDGDSRTSIDLDKVVMSKPSFEKISFNIFIPKYFGGRETKTLEVSKNGNFVIYKKGKVIKFYYIPYT